MDLLRDSNGDLDLTDNRIKFTKYSSDLIRQRLAIRLHVNLNEWKFNVNFGLPWITDGKEFQILSKSDFNLVDSIIRDQILTTEGVLSILEYNTFLDKTTRAYSIKARVKLIDNTTIDIFESL